MARSKHPQGRPEVTPCQDHLAGSFAEALFERMVELGWLTPPPDVTLTEAGSRGLARFGVELTTSRQPVVTRCLERRGSRVFLHAGGQLGAALRRHLEQLGWVRRQGGTWVVIGAGWKGLQNLGQDEA